mmetsp:Transcript_93793/g.186030  ORF Transcript_93793/g.186030 Transcript_93793/m.186030 type:complete len:110 (+) Transcript_93793:676-1005(+)
MDQSTLHLCPRLFCGLCGRAHFIYTVQEVNQRADATPVCGVVGDLCVVRNAALKVFVVVGDDVRAREEPIGLLAILVFSRGPSWDCHPPNARPEPCTQGWPCDFSLAGL